VVPVTALRHGTSGDFVYVLQEDRTVKVRPVTRGQATVDVVQVATGLEVGERVVTEGGDRLKEGARVQLAGDRPAGALSGASGAYGGRRGGASGAERSGRAFDAASGAYPSASGASAVGRRASGPGGRRRAEGESG
jgi:multidrug efflux system membrane fusion protein